MDKAEAHKILTEQLARFTDHAQLVPLVESQHVENCEVFGASGTRYQVEVQFFWDDAPMRAIRVVASIDDGVECAPSFHSPRHCLFHPMNTQRPNTPDQPTSLRSAARYSR